MSIQLTMGTRPDGVCVKSDPRTNEVWITFPKSVAIDISMEDFCVMVRYVMENTDLLKGDARLELIKRIKKSIIGRGYGGVGSRKIILGKFYKNEGARKNAV